MRSRSLVPFRERSAPTRPNLALFGLHREIDRLFNELVQAIASNLAIASDDGTKSLTPNIEITETDEAIEVAAEMPGLERKDVEISIEDDTLTIQGDKKVEENQKDKNVQHSERIYGMFMRVLQLPSGTDPSSIQAARSDGVVKVTIPNRPSPCRRRSRSRTPRRRRPRKPPEPAAAGRVGNAFSSANASRIRSATAHHGA
ncbi:Hsp20/alpha crystallin family protein [Bradyrhizobium brasilense]|uniref:Hsp20/alpha crystallin family protein n=1 Tax=Bradyrhizobium brasilense TaxID=1419277 RepID=UPI0024B0B956|nr:Hsp20/alpha crystallin family protein [Bradyrhizobium australafricanum]WFU34386.1 Hsp20/alpha crystallin family protein [Bradyrhizobium australafricanum]